MRYNFVPAILLLEKYNGDGSRCVPQVLTRAQNHIFEDSQHIVVHLGRILVTEKRLFLFARWGHTSLSFADQKKEASLHSGDHSRRSKKGSSFQGQIK